MSRLPIRIRLTVVFTLALAIMLGTAGVFVYQRHRSDLDAAIDQGLRARSGELGDLARVGAAAGTLRATHLEEPDESLTAILDADGRVVDATPNLARSPLLSAGDLARARRAPTIGEVRVRGFDAPVRFLAARVPGDRSRIDVVGVALADRDEALAALRKGMLLAAPFALLAVALGTYGLAALALRPVEAMRRRAAEISATRDDERLPVPAARDELARLGETLNAMIDRLQSALERERRFAADASHELRTPLALLRTEIDLALDGDQPRAELIAALVSAGQETDRLIRLADDLLLLARADEDQLALQSETVAVADLFDDVEKRFAPAVKARMRTIQRHSPADLFITVDHHAMERALGNLVTNALHHGVGRIELAAIADPLELHVIDHGGTELEPAALFERFRRGAGAHGGSGLGLSIVAAIARAHGGKAGATSTPGRFDAWIRLPDNPATPPPTGRRWPAGDADR